MNHAQALGPCALATMLMITACGGPASATPSASPAGAKPAAAAPASSAPAPAKPAASAPASAAPKPSAAGSAAPSAAGSAAAGAPIKVGVIQPLTGFLANVGKDNRDGFNMYLESIGNTVGGHKLQVTVADGQAQPDTGLTKAKQLVESEKVDVLMGIASTPLCYAVAGYVKEAHVPLIVSNNCGAQSLTTDPKFQSPYLFRTTQVGTQFGDAAADWGYKAGYRKAVLIASDFGGALETGDSLASAFVSRGGSIVQELYPPLGTNDFGPYLSQLTQSADVVFVIAFGTDALRFAEAYGNYGAKKPPLIGANAQIGNGPNLLQLKDKALGVVEANIYSEAYDNPVNAAFQKAFHDANPGRALSTDVALGYSGAQVLVAALKKIDGNVQDKQRFLDALASVDIETAKGPLKFDKFHDVVQNIYINKTVKKGDAFGQQLVETYKGLDQYWDRDPAQFSKLPIGKMKGKWVGMTKDKLDAMTK